MRTITFFVFVLFFLTGCSKYQLVTVSTDSPKGKRGSIEIENDTLAIQYAFSGIQGPARIKVINHTSKPIYIKWAPTSQVRETWPSNTIKPALFTADAVGSNPLDVAQDGARYHLIHHNEQILVVKPFGATLSYPVNLSESFFRMSTPSMQNGELNGDKMRYQFFERGDSPLLFSGKVEWSYDDSFSNSETIVSHFWVDGVIVTMARPEYVPEFKGREDTFYLRKGSGFGVILAITGFLVYLMATQGSN